MSQKITIIGGGIIGLATAYALILKQIPVELVESNTNVGLETSFANGGQLSYRYVSPLADSGVYLQSLGWIGKSSAPLNMRIRFSYQQIKWQWVWLLKFLLACNKKTNAISSSQLLDLSLYSQKIFNSWFNSQELEAIAWKKNGKLVIYRNSSEFNRAKLKINASYQEALEKNEVLELEPTLKHLAPLLKGGIMTSSEEVADSYKCCLSLLNKLNKSELFTFLPNTRVTEIKTKNSKVYAIKTNRGEIPTDKLIICAGNGARDLLMPLGINVPIYPLKGYSLTFPYSNQSNILPEISVTDFSKKIVYANLDNIFRVAAMVDIGYENTNLRSHRVEALKKIVSNTFPELKASILEDAELWSGLRPSTPKGLPIIGETKYNNLYLNIGHGSLGFTIAAGSGAILGSLISENKTDINIEGFTM